MPPGSPARTVGARLREAREKRGLSLSQIAAKTRISAIALEAIERTDVSRLPGGIYTRAFVRTYAQEVGLDPDLTTQEFIAGLPAEAAPPPRPMLNEEGEKLESDRTAVVTAFRLILVSVPLAGLVMYYSTHWNHAAGRPAIPQPASSVTFPPPVADPTADSPPRTVEVVPPESAPTLPAQSAATSVPIDGFVMDIEPKGECWVSLTVDGEQVFSGIMKAGERRQVAAHDEIALNVGDAGVFAYSLNGRAGRPLGARGEVVSKRIRTADITDYVTP